MKYCMAYDRLCADNGTCDITPCRSRFDRMEHEILRHDDSWEIIKFKNESYGKRMEEYKKENGQ
jgi:hypothetical protein